MINPKKEDENQNDEDITPQQPFNRFALLKKTGVNNTKDIEVEPEPEKIILRENKIKKKRTQKSPKKQYLLKEDGEYLQLKSMDKISSANRKMEQKKKPFDKETSIIIEKRNSKSRHKTQSQINLIDFSRINGKRMSFLHNEELIDENYRYMDG
jgi:hypothetical protein